MNNQSIDSQTQQYCFLMTILFFLDFISIWFDQYSIYFAGERSDKVSNFVEDKILKIYHHNAVFLITAIFSEGYLIGEYMG